MAQDIAETTARRDHGALSVNDKIVVVLLACFALVAYTLELYWLLFHQTMESRDDIIATIFALYWPADYTYRIPGYPPEKSFTLALESVHVFVTQALSFLLIWAILKRKAYRYALQLTIGAYAFYGVFLYYYVAHISGYKVFAHHGPYPYLMFYSANLPWAIFYGWMGWDAFRQIVSRSNRER